MARRDKWQGVQGPEAGRLPGRLQCIQTRLPGRRTLGPVLGTSERAPCQDHEHDLPSSKPNTAEPQHHVRKGSGSQWGVPGLLCVLVRKRSYQKQSNHRQPALGWWDAGRLATGATAQAVLAWRKGRERLWGDPSALGRNAAVRLGWGGTAQTRTCPRGTHRPLRVSLWPARGLKPKARSRAAGKASVGLWMRT